MENTVGQRMKNRRKLGAKRKTLRVLAYFFIVLAVVSTALSVMWDLRTPYGVESLNAGWSLEDGEEATLPLRRGKNAGHAPLVLHRKLDGNFSVARAICFFSDHQSVRVTLEGEPLYVFPNGEDETGGEVDCWNLVDIPAGSNGKVLTLEFSASAARWDSGIGECAVGERGLMIQWLMEQARPAFVISWMLLALGIAVEFIVLMLKLEESEGGLYLGMLLILTGFLSLTFCDMYGFIGETSSWRETVCLTLMPLSASMLLLYISKGVKEKWVGMLYYLAAIGPVVSGVMLLFRWMNWPWAWVLLAGQFYKYFSIIVCLLLRRERLRQVVAGVVLVVCMAAGFFFYYVGRRAQVMPLIQFGTFFYVGEAAMEGSERIIRRVMERRLYQEQTERLYQSLLSSQIKPHFLYNALQTINVLISSRPEEAQSLLISFSKYLRGSIDGMMEQRLIPLQKELENVDAYLSVALAMRKEQIKVVYETEAKDFAVPPLSVQPLVENAIKHGLANGAESGTIWVRCYHGDGEDCIEVEDNGRGFDRTIHREGGVALNNVKNRLRILHGTLEVSSTENVGTLATIRIPRGSVM